MRFRSRTHLRRCSARFRSFSFVSSRNRRTAGCRCEPPSPGGMFLLPTLVRRHTTEFRPMALNALPATGTCKLARRRGLPQTSEVPPNAVGGQNMYLGKFNDSRRPGILGAVFENATASSIYLATRLLEQTSQIMPPSPVPKCRTVSLRLRRNSTERFCDLRP